MSSGAKRAPFASAKRRRTAPAVQASFVRAERIVPTSTQNGSCVCASISSIIGALCALNSRFSALSTAGMSLTVIRSYYTIIFPSLAPTSRRIIVLGIDGLSGTIQPYPTLSDLICQKKRQGGQFAPSLLAFLLFRYLGQNARKMSPIAFLMNVIVSAL